MRMLLAIILILGLAQGAWADNKLIGLSEAITDNGDGTLTLTYRDYINEEIEAGEAIEKEIADNPYDPRTGRGITTEGMQAYSQHAIAHYLKALVLIEQEKLRRMEE